MQARRSGFNQHAVSAGQTCRRKRSRQRLIGLTDADAIARTGQRCSEAPVLRISRCEFELMKGLA